MLYFANFGLDLQNQELVRDGRALPLTPKAFAVLRHLVENAGRLVTKQELLDTVWKDTFVQEAVLKVCILEIRKALQEDSREPWFIQTLHRKGYRFIAEVSSESKASAPRLSGLIGREGELGRLRDSLKRAQNGQRQLIFLAGEPGVGKTTLLRHFADELGSEVRYLSGHCLDHFGDQEAYSPVFEAFTQSARADSTGRILSVLRKHAPAWLVQMPSLLDGKDDEALRRAAFGATQERMLREMSEAIEALATEEITVIGFEDLHWSDPPTLNLIARIAHRRSPAKLVLVGTYRPVDTVLREHPFRGLKQDLRARGLCDEITLECLDEQHIEELLDERFGRHELPPEVSGLLYWHTEGNPLFVANVLDYAISHSLIVNESGCWKLVAPIEDLAVGVPDTLRHMIERQIERLSSPEREVLESASVAGVEFVTSVIGDVEEICEDLARRTVFLRETGMMETPDGLSAVYAFTHSLYREVFYLGLSPVRRTRLHQQVGDALERLYAGSINEHALDLAKHFAEARDHVKAIQYFRKAANRACSLHALDAALHLLERAKESLQKLPQRTDLEAELIEQFGFVYRLMGRLEAAAGKFEELSRLGDSRKRLNAEIWLASVLSWLDRERCLECIGRIAALADTESDPLLKASARGQVAYWNLLYNGWDEKDVEVSAEALHAAEAAGDRPLAALLGARHTYFLALQSRYREAGEVAVKSVRLAIQTEGSQDYSIALFYHAWALLHAGEWEQMAQVLQEAQTAARRNSNDMWLPLFRSLEAWMYVHTGKDAVAIAEEAVEGTRRNGHKFGQMMTQIVLGSAHLNSGDLDRAAAVLYLVRDWQARERILMDWMWALPLHAALADLEFQRGDFETALRVAQRFVELADATSERTYKELAHKAYARVAARLPIIKKAARRDA